MLVATITKFISVGVLNTLIDFFIFNLLTTRRLGFRKIPANLCSTTVAMTFSFLANKTFVFGANGNTVTQAVLFIGVTAFGLYVLQNIVIYTLTEAWLWPGQVVSNIVRAVGLQRLFKRDFVNKNTAKIAATVVSLTWNFIMYQKVVFHA